MVAIGVNPPFDLMIFDCDGVLIDSELLAAQVDVACLAEEGMTLSIEVS